MTEAHPSDVLSGYLDAALSPQQAAEVAAHLAECESCRAVLGDLQSVRAVLRAVPRPSPHPALLPRMLARLAAGRQREAFLVRWGVTVAVMAAAAIAILFLPLAPRPSAAHNGTRYFRQHAEMTQTLPIPDVSLPSYLSTPLPYHPAVDEVREWR
ncbi:MAG: zf-HC2 domain-containing protein [Armatimonadota bacterium]|nr:zf-HC2 domain-containing protein [Armatimonadota bacterium]MDR7421254.1 zf-HC2 domain-containing protein [Armatimonadota bacterium]MDR7455469.1 zf-HC2 domain-containing protein [Armatimonadota bacterium]MDR7455823.1 zf-HC2 domain-containing protein [Armatimonadota bacterium]MDR7511129.1 zf-HC2 domain-containing protein [Armatimonadota bacterium]